VAVGGYRNRSEVPSASVDLYATAVLDDDVMTMIRESNFRGRRRRILDQLLYCTRTDDLG
jgi:hypothetical protein